MVSRNVSRVEVSGTPASRRARRDVVRIGGRRRMGEYYGLLAPSFFHLCGG